MRQPQPDDPALHPFVAHPHRTLVGLSLPVLISLIAEPLTGLADTAFVARLGSEPLAALGVGTAALSSVFWIFNFLGIGTQTTVAQALGRQNESRAARIAGLGLVLSLIFGALLLLLGWWIAPVAALAAGADGAILVDAVAYMRARLFGAPAVLVLLTAFGALRGLQDMRTPLWIALGLNVVNIGLDALFIPGLGPFPALGVAGAGYASAIAQWLGALVAFGWVVRELGWPAGLRFSEAGLLLRVGWDLFLRTGLLTLFLFLTTRAATLAGAESGAAHQAIRQVWNFAALGLDALAITAQSLVGYFMGSAWRAQARRVATVGAWWSLGFGVVLAAGLLLAEPLLARLLVPPEAWGVFGAAWWVATAVQPINALAFVTDGFHWGTGDFAYLRNGMFLATGAGVLGLLFVPLESPRALFWIWVATAFWIVIRAVIGTVRVWPGVGRAPLAPAASNADD